MKCDLTHALVTKVRPSMSLRMLVLTLWTLKVQLKHVLQGDQRGEARTGQERGMARGETQCRKEISLFIITRTRDFVSCAMMYFFYPKHNYL
jgi:hypothetical protein